MRKDKLFKETPFNGYRRNDVIEYIEDLDRDFSMRKEEYENRISDLSFQLKQSQSVVEELEVKNAELEAELNILRESEAVAVKEKNEALLHFSEMSLSFEALQHKIAEQTEKLAALNSSFEDINAVTNIKDSKIAELEALVKNYREQESVFAEVQNCIDEVLADVRAEAEQIKEDAKKEAESIIAHANARASVSSRRPVQKENKNTVLDKLASFRNIIKNL